MGFEKADELGASEEWVTRQLIEHAETLYKRSAFRVNFKGNTDADDLLNDLARYPHGSGCRGVTMHAPECCTR